MTEVDPFAGADKVPSLSFDKAEIGTTYNGTITEGPKLVQSRDFKTGQPAVWENKDGSTSPKMAVVLRMKVDEFADSEEPERAVWATKPSALFAALHEAQKTAGDGVMKTGGRLAIRYTGDKPAKGGSNLNPAKQYAAKYTPPAPADPLASEDPWASAPTQPAF